MLLADAPNGWTVLVGRARSASRRMLGGIVRSAGLFVFQERESRWTLRRCGQVNRSEGRLKLVVEVEIVEEEGYAEVGNARRRLGPIRVQHRAARDVQEMLVPRNLPIVARLSNNWLRDTAQIEGSVASGDNYFDQVDGFRCGDWIDADDAEFHHAFKSA